MGGDRSPEHESASSRAKLPGGGDISKAFFFLLMQKQSHQGFFWEILAWCGI